MTESGKQFTDKIVSTKIRTLLSDCILIKLEPEKKEMASGIIIPDTSPEPIRVGEVLMTGPGKQFTDKFVPMADDLVGKRVAFFMATAESKQGLQLTQYLDEDTRIIRQGDVLCVIEEGVEVSW